MGKYDNIDFSHAADAFRYLYQQQLALTTHRLPGAPNMLCYVSGGTHTQWFWRHSQGFDLAIQSLVGPRGQRQLERPRIVGNNPEERAMARSINAVNYLLTDKRLPPDFFTTPTISRYEPTDWLHVSPKVINGSARLGGALVVAALPESAAKMLLELVCQTRTCQAIFRYPTQQWVLDDGTLVDLPSGAPRYEDPNDAGSVSLAPGSRVTISRQAVGSYNDEPAQIIAYNAIDDLFVVQLLSDPNGKPLQVDGRDIIY